MKGLTPKEEWDSWDEGKGTQPPGIVTPVKSGLVFAENKSGHYVTCGWFEYNVLIICLV